MVQLNIPFKRTGQYFLVLELIMLYKTVILLLPNPRINRAFALILVVKAFNIVASQKATRSSHLT